MKAQYRMLLWEQSRTAGVLCGYIAVLALLFFFAIRFELLSGYNRHVFDFMEDTEYVILGALLLAAVALIVRQNGQAHLSLDFEPRLLRLPMKLMPMVVIVYGIRALCLCGLALLLYVVYWALYGVSPNSSYVVLPLNLFLFAQALAWVRPTISGLSYLAPSTIVAAALLGQTPLSILLDELRHYFFEPRFLPVFMALNFTLAWLGVNWARRDERHGPPPLNALVGSLIAIGVRTPPPFTSAFEAQLWYEQRRVGRLLPWLTLLLTFLFSLLFMALPSRLFDEHTRFWFAPLAALPAAALIVGPISLRPANRYPFARPQFPTILALAVMLTQLRAVLFCFFMVSALATLGMMLSGYEGLLLVRMVEAGVTDLLGAVMLVMRPAFTMTLLAWVLLWVSLLPVAIPILAIVAAFLVEASVDYRDYAWIVEEYGITPVIMIAVLIGALLALYYVSRYRLFSRVQILLGLALWQNLVLLLLVASPYAGFHIYSLVACMSVATWTMLPVVAAPMLLYRRRLKG